MDAHAGITLYPHVSLRVLSCLVHLLGISIIAHCISRRLNSEAFPTWNSLFTHWPRLCVVIGFIDSWLFVFSAALILFGVGLQLNPQVCSAAIYLCIAFYGTSKVMIYIFLTEKVYVVWNNGKPRLQTPAYLFSVVSVALYLVPVILMIIGRVHYFRDGDEACIVGLSQVSSLTILSYDLFISTVLTGLFLWPLFRTKMLNPRIRRAASRTCIAAFISLVMSSANIAVIAALHGHEFGWLCLGSCSIDVTTNTLALFWVTSGATARAEETYVTNTMSGRGPTKFAMSAIQNAEGNNGAHALFGKGQQGQGLQISVTTQFETDLATNNSDDNVDKVSGKL